ncbi:hypothetical protein NBRC116590_11210 [Pelagimonas sp. KU-00592-HH]
MADGDGVEGDFDFAHFGAAELNIFDNEGLSEFVADSGFDCLHGALPLAGISVAGRGTVTQGQNFGTCRQMPDIFCKCGVQSLLRTRENSRRPMPSRQAERMKGAPGA